MSCRKSRSSWLGAHKGAPFSFAPALGGRGDVVRTRRSSVVSRENTCNGIHRSINIAFVRLPVADTDAHSAFSAPRNTAEEHLTVGENAFDHLIRVAIVIAGSGIRFRREETHKPLVDAGSPKKLRAG